nr:PREDICTED: protein DETOXIFICATION 55 [Daucus carota subsp. sativus]
MAPQHNYKQLKLPEVIEELKKISSIGFPILAMGLVNYVRNMISVVCMGRLGSIELAGGALAIGFTNITGYSVLSGLAMGMEPLCSQAFGSGNLTIVSLTLQRTIFMLLFTSIPITLLWLNLEPLMLLLHQNREITKIASLYCFYAIPDLVANSFLQPLRIYLRSKGATRPFMWCTVLATILHLPVTIFLTFNLHLGVKGIALSIIITNFVSLFFLVSYMFCTRSASSPALSMPLLSIASNNGPQGEDWGMLLRLAIPSCLAVCLEWWWYELMTLSAGYLKNPEAALAASAIVIQTTSLLYTLPSALSASISTRVGNELGAGRPRQACLSSRVAIGLALLSSTMGLLWTTIGRTSWIRVFTKDTEVFELTMAALPIIGLCEIANCPQTTCCGVLRGSARPSVGAGINFYSFYLVGAPVAVALAFVWKLEFLGLCYGLLAAQVSCVLTILTVIYKTDWEEESLKARHLVGGHDEYFTYPEIIKSQQRA